MVDAEGGDWIVDAGLARVPDGPAPIYLRIRDHVALSIRRGSLAPGARLPPVRALAGALSVNPMTVARAYRHLAEAGLVEGRGGAGTVVLPQRDARPDAVAPPAAPSIPPADPGSLSARLFDLSNAPGVISFTANYPDAHRSSAPALRRRLAALAARDEADDYFRYGPPEGLLSLRKAMARLLADDGVVVPPDRLLITSGGQQGLDLVVRALVRPGDRVLIERPAYFGLLGVLHAAGAEIIDVPVGGRGPDPDDIRAAIRRSAPRLVALNPTFQNPTGATMDSEVRKAILSAVREGGVALLEDDPYPEMRFRGERPLSLRSLAEPEEPVFYCRGLGKCHLPGVGIGVLAAPAAHMPALRRLKAGADLQSNAFLQRAISDWLDGDDWRTQSQATAAFYADRQARLLSALRSKMPEGVRMTEPDGGLNIWLKLPTGAAVSDLYFRAVRYGVAFADGAAFFAQPGGQICMRISFGRIAGDDVEEGAGRLSRLLADICAPSSGSTPWYV